MTRKVIIFTDGMFMPRRVLERNHFLYKPREIREYCQKHLRQNDYLVRITFYDYRPLQARETSPLNGSMDMSRLTLLNGIDAATWQC